MPEKEKVDVRKPDKYECFETELTHLINRLSMENGSNTPDYVLARYLTGCLRQYERTSSDCLAHQGRNEFDRLDEIVRLRAEGKPFEHLLERGSLFLSKDPEGH